MYITYILKSKIKDWYYVGYTSNIEKRLSQHNAGLSKATKPYMPFELVHEETFATRSEAFKREHQIKSYRHGQAFKKLIGA